MSWKTALVLGICFGLGYGLTQRLLLLRPGSAWPGFQPFGVKPFPGTELDSLREESGSDRRDVRADLDQMERERQREKEREEQEEDYAERRSALEERDRDRDLEEFDDREIQTPEPVLERLDELRQEPSPAADPRPAREPEPLREPEPAREPDPPAPQAVADPPSIAPPPALPALPSPGELPVSPPPEVQP